MDYCPYQSKKSALKFYVSDLLLHRLQESDQISQSLKELLKSN